MLDDLGLKEALRWLLPRLQQRYGFDGRLTDSRDWDAVPQSYHAPCARTKGFGLFSVERRLALMSGSLRLQSTPGEATSATMLFASA